jgi:TRAP-type mannitol/chloroaromatic compound transport system permease large subunit
VRLPFVWKTAALTFLKAIPALFMIAVILGGILGGVFTPTEASFAAARAGGLTWRRITDIFTHRSRIGERGRAQAQPYEDITL